MFRPGRSARSVNRRALPNRIGGASSGEECSGRAAAERACALEPGPPIPDLASGAGAQTGTLERRERTSDRVAVLRRQYEILEVPRAQRADIVRRRPALHPRNGELIEIDLF